METLTVSTSQTPMPAEVVIRPSPTSVVASDSGLTRPTAQKAKPHLQPHWRYNVEAETPVPQPPPVRKCSVRHSYTLTPPHGSESILRPFLTPLLLTPIAVVAVSLFHQSGYDNRRTSKWQHLFCRFCPFLTESRPGTIPRRPAGKGPITQPLHRFTTAAAMG